MFQLEVGQVMARDRREAYERQAEVHRLLREAKGMNGEEMRVPFTSRVLYTMGRLMVRVGDSLQRPYCETVEMTA